jgi:hypothetical protein
VKTALVLFEFHQSHGTAWFDDIVLEQGGSNSGQNLLASPGFEESDPVAEKATAAGQTYENQIRSLLSNLEAARQSFDAGGQLTVLEKQAEAAVMWIHGGALAPYFARELRDLNELLEKLRLCSRIAVIGPR